MARRKARWANGGWWIVVVLVAAALALWWLRGRRVEAPVAPPAITTGDRVLAEPSPGQRDVQGDDAEEITPPEKQELDRVLREHSGTPAR